jgi:hypothetical protein
MTNCRFVQFVLFAVLLLLAACQQTPTPQSAPEADTVLTSQAVTPGRVVGWGDNSKGQLNIPFGLNNVIAIEGGASHSLALKSDGTVVAWGDNSYGQLNIPAGLNNIIAIAAGDRHNLALKSSGTVVAWGYNYSGQTNVPTIWGQVTAIAAGATHSLALKSDGTVVAWGDNGSGQLNIPTGLRYVIAIAAGDSYSLALKSDGTVVAWGNNQYGQTYGPYGLYKYNAISAGTAHGLALSNGRVVTWGYNIINPDGSGELSVPAGLFNVSAIAAGQYYSLALRSDGTVVAWGIDEPTVPAGLNGVLAIAAGNRHSLALIPNLSVTINQDAAQPDPTSRAADANFVATFSAPVTGFTSADVVLGGTADLSRATILVSGGPSTYRVEVRNLAGNGTVTASIAANAVTDTWGNTNPPSTSTDNTVTLDRIRPSVTLNQASGQADPTNAGSINFTAVFSEAITQFDPTDIRVSGTAGASTVTLSEVAPNDGTTFNVAVSGMSVGGTVIVFIDSGKVFDKAGHPNLPSTSTDNSVTYTAPIPDSTPPVISPTVTGTLGTNEWYTSDVNLSWTVVDNESSISSQVGCDAQSVTTDTTGVTFICAATSTGGSASQSVIIKRDATTPTVSVTGVDEGGSYPSDPTLGCQTTDETSGIASEAVPFITDNGGGSFTATCTNTDNAGNTASASVTYSVIPPDTTAPSAAPSITDTSGNPLSASAAGWYNKQVQVTWSWSDDTGIDTANCTTSTSSSGQGELTLSATCNDVAGNQGSDSVVVKVDTVAPTTSYTSVSPASPNAKGWYNTNVTLSFTGTDATSGIASCPSKTIGEGFGKTARGICTDNAGNQKTRLSPAFNIDKTKPVVNVLMNGSVVSGTTPSYSLAQGIPSASCETTDALSGVATSASISIVKVTSSGEVAATNPPTLAGTYKAKCLGALDNADNASSRTVTFKVTR